MHMQVHIASSLTWKPIAYIASSVCDPQNKDIVALSLVHNHVVSDRKAASARSEILVARTAQVRESSQQKEAVRYGIDESIGNLDAAAFFRDVKPDVVKIALGRRRYAMRH